MSVVQVIPHYKAVTVTLQQGEMTETFRPHLQCCFQKGLTEKPESLSVERGVAQANYSGQLCPILNCVKRGQDSNATQRKDNLHRQPLPQIYINLVCFEKESHSLVVANLWQSSSLSLPSAGITSMSYDAQLWHLTSSFSSFERVFLLSITSLCSPGWSGT